MPNSPTLRAPIARRIEHKANGLTRAKQERPTKDWPNEAQIWGCRRDASRLASRGSLNIRKLSGVAGSTLEGPLMAELESFSFGDSPELADELLELVLTGKKTATCWAASEGDKGVAIG